jgi:catechol 2,3-dioxygenase-like lactoylglutathione lyase family enzyme
MDTPAQPSLQVQRLRSIGLTVSDVDRSKAFYTQALGFEVVSDVTTEEQSNQGDIAKVNLRMVTLQLGDERIKLMQYLDVVGQPIPQDSQSNDLWFQHLAIVVSDMERAYDHLTAFSIEPISTKPQTIPPGNKEAAYIQAFKFKDPDRHDLELIWFPPDKGQDKWHQITDQLFLGIDHSAIVVRNTEQSLQFYRDLLGMQIKGGSFNWRETQARLDGLPGVEVRVTALRPAQGGLGIELLDYVAPAHGRLIPSDRRRWDSAYMQIECVVNDLHHASQQLQKNHIQCALLKRLSSSSLPPDHEEYLINDPNGHAVLLVSG